MLLFGSLRLNAQSSHIVISQFYGGGGNAGAIYKYDYVELYNPTNSTVSLTGWSLQYAGATSSNWSSNKVDLAGSILPGKYFLIQLGSGTAGSELPQPDQVSPAITMSATSGKVALVNNTTLLSGNCPALNNIVPGLSNIVDFVGYGTADCFEGAKAPAASVSTALFRLKNGCKETDNNLADFAAATPSPKNSQHHAQICSSDLINVNSVTGLPFCVTTSSGTTGTVQYSATGTFTNARFEVHLSDAIGSFGFSTIIGTATVSGVNPTGIINITIPANSPSGTKYKVKINSSTAYIIGDEGTDFEITNGAKNVTGLIASPNTTEMTILWTNPASCFDEIMLVAKQGASITGTPVGNGTAYTADLNFNGAGSAFDGGKVVYKGTASGQKIINLSDGISYYFKVFSRRGSQWSAGMEVTEKPRLMPLPGEIVINQLSPGFATTTDEYVELLNVTGKVFDLTDLAIRYQASTGNPGVAGGTLSGMLQPYSFWLLSAKPTITVGLTSALKPDGSIADGFTGSGQIALVRKTDNAIIDGVGYGTLTGGTYTEGTAAPSTPSNGGIKRTIDGRDNNNNSTDFVKVNNIDIDLRNSSSRYVTGGAVPMSDTLKRLYTNGNAQLQSNIVVLEKVVLNGGSLSLGNFNLTTADVKGSSLNSYVKTNGTGVVNMMNIGTNAKFIPVGNSTYNPVTISNGENNNWSVRVEDQVSAIHNNRIVNRTWNITPSSALLSGATISLEYNDGDKNQTTSNFNTNEAVQVWNHHDGRWQPVGPSFTANGTPGSNRVATFSNWNKFSPFVVSNNTEVLPLANFNIKAAMHEKTVDITWNNLTEWDIEHYEVERSTNGKEFYKLSSVANVNNNNKIIYKATDRMDHQQKYYYRIKAFEKGGQIIISRIVMIATEDSQAEMTIFPNPIKDGLLSFMIENVKTGPYKIHIYNVSGVLMATEDIFHSCNRKYQSIMLKNLKKGSYVLLLNGASSLIKRFVVL